MFKGPLIFFLLSLTLQANAYYNLLPKGTRQSLLGNNGIALQENDGAGAYNPASIVGIKGPTLSASGSVLSISQINFGNSNLQDKSDAPTLDVNSAYISILFNSESFNYGFYFSNELNINFTKYFEYSATGFQGSFNIETSLLMNKLGFLIASENRNFFYGISPAIYNVSQRTNVLSKVAATGQTTTSFDLVHSSSTIFATRFGAGLKISDLSTGAYIEPAGVLISNRRTRHQSAVSTSGIVDDQSDTTKSALTTKTQWGVGIEYRISAKTSVVVDYSVLESEHFYDGDSDEESPKITRYGFGVGRNLNLLTQILFGYQASRHQAFLDKPSIQSFYANVGVERKISFLNSLLNVFYSDYAGGESQANIKNIGISLGTSYAY